MPIFNRQQSHQLDALIFLMESRPPFLIRMALRFWKRRLERGIP